MSHTIWRSILAKVLATSALAVVALFVLYQAIYAGSPIRAATPDVVDVAIEDFLFSPSTITVTLGAAVRWTNNGFFAHTTTAQDLLWDSGALTSGNSFTHTFNQPGTFDYVCSIHPEMQGKVIVEVEATDFLFLPLVLAPQE